MLQRLHSNATTKILCSDKPLESMWNDFQDKIQRYWWRAVGTSFWGRLCQEVFRCPLGLDAGQYRVFSDPNNIDWLIDKMFQFKATKQKILNMD